MNPKLSPKLRESNLLGDASNKHEGTMQELLESPGIPYLGQGSP